MKRTLAILTLALLFVTTIAEAQRPGRGPRGGARWAPDGKHLIVGGKWVDPVSGKEVKPVEVPSEPDPVAETRDAFRQALQKALQGEKIPRATFTASRRRSTIPRTPDGSPGMLASSDGKRAAVINDGTLWAWDGKAATAVQGDLGAVRRVEMAPDGGAVSYLKDDNLFITRTDNGKTFQISSDAGENLFYGELDWVYQEEVYGRANFKATWWSPDGRYLAYLRTVEEGVDTFVVVDHIPNDLGLEHIKYPKAGTTNPVATLHVADAQTGKSVAVDLSGYDAKDEILIVRVGWTPESDNVLFKVQNREQTWLDLVFADPATGRSRTLIHEEVNDGWVNVLAMPRFLRDGTFVWESERNGFKHLYNYERSGKLRTAITSGEWEVRRIIRLDEDEGHVTYTGTKDGAVGPHAYRSSLDGKHFVRLTEGRGTHSIRLNADGSMLIDSFSSLENPGEVWLRGGDGKAIRQISSRKTKVGNVPKLHRIKARDGEWLDVTVQRPAAFDQNGKYPIWIETYSGPDAPTVRDSWRGDRSWASDNGMILLQVNVRSASGRGMKFTKKCYRQFGVQELMDIEDTVKWLAKTYSWADGSKVGISGWSYGGFMAAYALTHSKMFTCGVAGAGVYDWRLYDTIYTERYMATPQNNPEGYSRSSVIEAAKNLHGQLLIVHGTMDDNVHAQNALQLVHELQKANKQNFEFMLYPKSRHGVRSAHWRTLKQNFIKKHMLAAQP